MVSTHIPTQHISYTDFPLSETYDFRSIYIINKDSNDNNDDNGNNDNNVNNDNISHGYINFFCSPFT